MHGKHPFIVLLQEAARAKVPDPSEKLSEVWGSSQQVEFGSGEFKMINLTPAQSKE